MILHEISLQLAKIDRGSLPVAFCIVDPESAPNEVESTDKLLYIDDILVAPEDKFKENAAVYFIVNETQPEDKVSHSINTLKAQLYALESSLKKRALSTPIIIASYETKVKFKSVNYIIRESKTTENAFIYIISKEISKEINNER